MLCPHIIFGIKVIRREGVSVTKSERGQYRFSVKETAQGIYWIAAVTVDDSVSSLSGQLRFRLHDDTTLEMATHLAGLMNQTIAAIQAYTGVAAELDKPRG
jgi:hypothetical protein